MLRVAGTMRDWLRVVALEPGRLVYALAPGFTDDPAVELRDALLKATGERWQVERGEGESARRCASRPRKQRGPRPPVSVAIR
jgi:DNA polymerase-3 subunit gamma/tau